MRELAGQLQKRVVVDLDHLAFHGIAHLAGKMEAGPDPSDRIPARGNRQNAYRVPA